MSAAARNRQACLPFPEPVDYLEALAVRSRRLANVVEALSRRRDVRTFRAQLLLLLFELRCPLRGRPRRAWYVPGAVARLGAEGLRRAWVGFYGEHPRTLRTFRAHLGVLEQACAIVQAPGDFLPMRQDPEHPERRPRYPDTIHVVDSEAGALFWASAEGRGALERDPGLRYHPGRWKRVLGHWRESAHARQLDLFRLLPAGGGGSSETRPGGGAPRAPQGEVEGAGGGDPVPVPPAERAPTDVDAVRAVAAVVRRRGSALDVLEVLRAHGAHVRGRNTWRLASDPERLLGAAALLAWAVARGDRIRSRPAWLVRAFRHAAPTELAAARVALLELDHRGRAAQ